MIETKSNKIEPKQSGLIRRLIPIVIVLVCALVSFFVIGTPSGFLQLIADKHDQLVDLVSQYPARALVLYVVCYACLVILLWVPAWLCTAVGGFLFGPWIGFGAALIGATSGAFLVLAMARSGLLAAVERAGSNTKKLLSGLRGRAFSYLLILRLIPVFPFSLVNLLSAAAGVPYVTFAAATFLGIVPSTVIYATAGNAARNLALGELSPGVELFLWPDFIGPALGILVLALLPFAVKRFRRDQREPSK